MYMGISRKKIKMAEYVSACKISSSDEGKFELKKRRLDIGSYRLYAPSTFEKFPIMPHIKDNTVNC